MKKNKVRRGLCGLLALVMGAGLLSGCGKSEEQHIESVFTGDPDAVRVFVRTSSTYADTLREKFPDIKFDFYYYGGLNPTMMMNQLLERDDFGDLCITSLQETDAMAKEHLIDLSGYDFCGRYEPSILSQFDVDGKIYQLPGYVTMRSIVYNQDMFEEHGWKEPKSFNEFVNLCSRIRTETDDITPIVMGGAASGYYFTTMTTYAQSEFLFTPDGQEWTKAYQEGKAKAEEGFGEGIRMVQELIDAEAFDPEKNQGLWDGTLFEQRMLTDEAAMIYVWGGQARIANLIEENPDKHFGIMPLRNRGGQAFIGTNIPYYIGVSKVLEDSGNEKKLEQVMRIVEWLSTEEGISALSTESLSAIYPLKKAQNAEALPLYRDFWAHNLDAIKAPMLYAGYEDILAPTAEKILETIEEKGRLDGLAEMIDEIHAEFLEGGAEAIEAGSIEKDFTHEQTVQLFADVLYAQGDSDLALVSDGLYKDGILNFGGVFSRLFEGPIIDDRLSSWLPGNTVTDKAVQMKLTGAQLKELLEKGKAGMRYATDGMGMTYRTEEVPEGALHTYFDYYWSGMETKWKNGSVVSMKLADGRNVEDEEVYTVTFAFEDYTIEMEENCNPTPLSYTAQDAFEKYLEANSPVKPPKVLSVNQR